MKKGYKKLLFFEFIVFIITILNSFVSSILSRYNMIFFLAILLLIFKFIFGFEKDRHRFTKSLFQDIIIVLLMFFILFYLSGIIIGFARTENYLNINGLYNFIIPVVGVIILKEILRYEILTKSEGSKLLIVTSCILFMFLDVTNVIYYSDFSTKYNSFLFITLNLLPAFSTNIVATYISMTSGYKPIILYQMIFQLYGYVLPIIPDANEYITSLIRFLLPVLVGRRVYLFYKNEKDEEVLREYKKRSIFPLVVSSLVVIVMVYFISGYFTYHAIAIASGSMTPNINKGDVVVIEKIGKDYSRIKKGTVIAYKYEGVTIVHRVINVIKEKGEYVFYTKGDANKQEDGYAIRMNMVEGVVNFKVRFIGWPTVWLNEL